MLSCFVNLKFLSVCSWTRVRHHFRISRLRECLNVVSEHYSAKFRGQRRGRGTVPVILWIQSLIPHFPRRALRYYIYPETHIHKPNLTDVPRYIPRQHERFKRYSPSPLLPVCALNVEGGYLGIARVVHLKHYVSHGQQKLNSSLGITVLHFPTSLLAWVLDFLMNKN